MSGRSKAEMTLALNQILNITSRLGEETWDNVRKRLQTESESVEQSRNEAESLMNTDTLPDGVLQDLQSGQNLLAESEELRKKAESLRTEAIERMNEVRRKTQEVFDTIQNKREKDYSLYRDDNRVVSCERDAQKVARTENEALQTMEQAANRARDARKAFEQIKARIEKRNLERVAVAGDIRSVQMERDSFGVELLESWSGNPTLFVEAQNTLQNAEEKLATDDFEGARRLLTTAAESFRKLYEMAMKNRVRVESRNVVAKAIVEALKELEYDQPAVGYVRAEGEAVERNHRLNDLEILAHTSSGTGNMRLLIDMDGKVDLDIDNISEGEETECLERINDLRSRTAGIVDIDVTDWGRAAHARKDPGGGGTGAKSKVKEQVKFRQRDCQ